MQQVCKEEDLTLKETLFVCILHLSDLFLYDHLESFSSPPKKNGLLILYQFTSYFLQFISHVNSQNVVFVEIYWLWTVRYVFYSLIWKLSTDFNKSVFKVNKDKIHNYFFNLQATFKENFTRSLSLSKFKIVEISFN